MGDVENRFHLGKLPTIALQNVLYIMRLYDLLMYSFCSKRTTDHVHSLNSRRLRLDVVILEQFIFQVLLDHEAILSIMVELEDLREEIDDTPLVINRIETIANRAFEEFENTMINPPELSLEKWIHHLLHIFHSPKIYDLTIHHFAIVFDRNSLQKAFKKIKIRTLVFEEFSMEGSYVYMSEVFPQATSLEFSKFSPAIAEPGVPAKFFQRTVIQNLRVITILWQFSMLLDLSDLLVIRIPIFIWCGANISDKTINRFIRLWLIGSNSELDAFLCLFDNSRVLNINLIFESVSTRDVGPNEKRLRKKEWMSLGLGEYSVKDRYVIQRMDLVEATISIYTNDNGANCFDFVVWA